MLGRSRPDLVVVQGDTTTTFCGALAAFYSGVPVAHVEAGLRTGDLRQPFPEEMNRVLTSRLANSPFCADRSGAADNLAAEGIRSNVWVTGNTGIDAVLYVRDRLEERSKWPLRRCPFLEPGKSLVLVTAHRRESFGEGFERICRGSGGDRRTGGDVQLVYPVHPNPQVQEPVNRHLRRHPGHHAAGASGLRDLCGSDAAGVSDPDRFRRHSGRRTVSGKADSGAAGEDRAPEAVEAGTVKLVGTDTSQHHAAATALLDDPEECARMSRIHNPYGDGHACERIEAGSANSGRYRGTHVKIAARIFVCKPTDSMMELYDGALFSAVAAFGLAMAASLLHGQRRARK